jgi:hypothetical protein
MPLTKVPIVSADEDAGQRAGIPARRVTPSIGKDVNPWVLNESRPKW